MNIAGKRQKEKRMMTMIAKLYCRGKKHPAGGLDLCPCCVELLNYAHSRTDRCPRMAEKTFCSKCPSPCYEPARREAIREMMCYAAPRLLLRHPIPVVKHMLVSKARESCRGREAEG